MEYVYIVHFDWTTDEESELETYVYADYKDAVKKMKALIANEMNPALSWVGDLAFNSAGKLNKGYHFYEFTDDSTGQDLFWRVANYENSSFYSFITLKKEKVL